LLISKPLGMKYQWAKNNNNTNNNNTNTPSSNLHTHPITNKPAFWEPPTDYRWRQRSERGEMAGFLGWNILFRHN